MDSTDPLLCLQSRNMSSPVGEDVIGTRLTLFCVSQSRNMSSPVGEDVIGTRLTRGSTLFFVSQFRNMSSPVGRGLDRDSIDSGLNAPLCLPL